MLQKRFEFKFHDRSAENVISFDYNDAMDEEMTVSIEHGVAVIYANKQAYLTLAKAFIKLALGNYQSGFHFHLGQDFNDDDPNAMRCHVVDSSES
ncbi:MAG: hypothetical protein AAF810_25095 [Cyanobacteria bacterium P01_D01_bin.36]